jgi:Sulfotransferase family
MVTASFLSRFDEFHEQAVKATGLDDFGPTEYVEPMRLLLADYDKHGQFTPIGEQITAGGMVGLLIARLFAAEGFKQYPQFTNAPVEKPIIILGLPRSGSTTLHRLLAQDPGTQHLVPWLGNTPMPRPPRETWETNPWYQMTKQALDGFWQIFPEVKLMHPMLAEEPDECRYAFESSFWSPAIAFTGPMTGAYAEWVAGTVPRYAYEHYRKVLGLVAGGDRRRWVLKDPTTHSWVPELLFETFPDAHYVYTHRDPLKAMASVSDMLYPVRSSRLSYITREQHGQEMLKYWAPAMEKLDAALSGLDQSRIIDIHMDELNADPVGSAIKIYEYFGLPVTEAAKQAWQRFVDADPRGGHGAHPVNVESVGLRAEEVYAAMPNYYAGYKRRYGDTS